MSIQVEEREYHRGEVEKSFKIESKFDDATEHVLIHPWVRADWTDEQGGNSVYLEVSEKDLDDGTFVNIIVNRKDFVEGLLAVFPELKRA